MDSPNNAQHLASWGSETAVIRVATVGMATSPMAATGPTDQPRVPQITDGLPETSLQGPTLQGTGLQGTVLPGPARQGSGLRNQYLYRPAARIPVPTRADPTCGGTKGNFTLDAVQEGAPCGNRLAPSVTVARLTLDQLVKVQILRGQFATVQRPHGPLNGCCSTLCSTISLHFLLSTSESRTACEPLRHLFLSVAPPWNERQGNTGQQQHQRASCDGQASHPGQLLG